MENNSKKIDRYFKEQLGQFEQQPQEAVWKNIASKLGHHGKKEMVFMIFRIAAGMALIISLGIGYYLVNRPGKRIESIALSNNKSSKAPNDTLVNRPRTIEENTQTIRIKKTDKSDRLEPVRKVYKGPAVKEEIATEREPQNKLSEVINKLNRSPNLYPWGLARIIPPRDQGLIPVDLPAGLFRSPLSIMPVMTTEEAMAMLLTETETPVKPDDSKHDRWILGGEIAPLYSYRTLTSDYLEPDMINSLNKSESALLAYAGGIRVAFSASRRLSVQSGVYYSRYGQEKNNVEIYSYNKTEYTNGETTRGSYLTISNSTGVIYSDQPDNAGYDKVISNSMGTADENNYFTSLSGFNYTNLILAEESNITATQHFDYLEVPLTVKYKIIDRKFDFSLSGGLVTNFLVGNVVTLEQNGEKTRFGKTNDITQINYLGSVGLGFEYPLVSGFTLSIEPRFRYYLNPIDKSSQINVHPYSFGFFAGISYIF